MTKIYSTKRRAQACASARALAPRHGWQGNLCKLLAPGTVLTLLCFCSINRLSAENIRELLYLIQPSKGNASLNAADIAEKYNARIIFSAGKLLLEPSAWKIQFQEIYSLQMIPGCVIPCESRFVWAFGRSQRDSNQKGMQKICR